MSAGVLATDIKSDACSVSIRAVAPSSVTTVTMPTLIEKTTIDALMSAGRMIGMRMRATSVGGRQPAIRAASKIVPSIAASELRMLM